MDRRSAAGSARMQAGDPRIDTGRQVLKLGQRQPEVPLETAVTQTQLHIHPAVCVRRVWVHDICVDVHNK